MHTNVAAQPSFIPAGEKRRGDDVRCRRGLT